MGKSKRLNRDHAKRTQRPMVEDRVIAEHLTNLLTPIMTSQSRYFRELGLRDRILTLPLMVVAVLTLFWRDVPGVTELTRLLETEGFLWCGKIKVSQQALSQRFLTFPAILFERMFIEILPNLKQKWSTRGNRPLPESVQFVLSKFENIWCADCSTLEALFCKLKSLEDVKSGKLAGKMGVKIDLVTRLPVAIWFGDAIADELSLPFDRISLEMVYRGLYYFHSASIRGEAYDPVKYFARPDIVKCLGIVKRQRKRNQKLIIAPFPDKQRGDEQFFFQFSPKSPLTTSLQA